MITAKTPNQKKYCKSIYDNDLTLCEGPSGVGKDMVGIGISLQLIFSDKNTYNKLILTRPMVGCGSSEFPSLPGSIGDKVAPYAAPLFYIIEELIGKKESQKLIENGTINFIPIELMRGFTFDNCCVVLSEMQNSTPQQALMAITRMGNNAKFVFNGDITQKDIRYYSGLEILLDFLKNTELAGIVQMTSQDNQRNPKINAILKAVDWQGSV